MFLPHISSNCPFFKLKNSKIVIWLKTGFPATFEESSLLGLKSAEFLARARGYKNDDAFENFESP